MVGSHDRDVRSFPRIGTSRYRWPIWVPSASRIKSLGFIAIEFSANERAAVNRACTMKDFEKQIAELKKENFNLKLRIYFLEEQVQQKCDNSSEDLYRMNIELKVELETSKHDLQEKQHLLIKASKALENLAEENRSKILQMKEDFNKNLQALEFELNQKISVLEKEVLTANEEADKIAELLDQEREQRFALESKVLDCQALYSTLGERARTIENGNPHLNSKDSSVVQFESQMSGCERCKKYLIQKDGLGMDLSPSDQKSGVGLDQNEIPEDSDHIACDLQSKLDDMEKKISVLQQKLGEKEAALVLHEENAVKRDKTIQGLTLALKNKEKEEHRKFDFKTGLKEYKKSYSQSVNTEGNQKEHNSVIQSKLEDEIQCNQQQNTILQDQVNKSTLKNDESSLFFGDETSYLSICLDHSGLRGDQLSMEDLQNMVVQLMHKIKEMQKSPVLEKATGCSGYLKSNDNETDSSTMCNFAKKSRIPILQKETLCMKKVPDNRRTFSKTILQEELQTCKLENDKIAEELWHAQEEIETLKAHIILLKGNGITPQRDHHEHPFDMDKTITNSVSLVETDEINNAEQELCAFQYDKNAESVLPLVTDCYDNGTNNKNEMQFIDNCVAETLLNVEKENNSPNNKCDLEDLSNEPPNYRYDLLVQAQARELSVQRQKIKESHILSITCYKNCMKVLKAFDELLEASDVDYYVAEAFQAHLNKFLQRIKKMEYKLGYDDDTYNDHSGNTPSCQLPGQDLQGDESGCQVLAVLNQLLEGGNMLREMEDCLDHCFQSSAVQVSEEFQKMFYEMLHKTQQSFEDASHLLRLYWREPLPNDLKCSQAIYEEEEINNDSLRLQNKVLEDKAFSIQGFFHEKHAEEETDKSILDHLALTYKVLKTARSNLELDANHQEQPLI
ncbi:CDK5 regulatory subunit-associated protein 2 isoform X1 [Xenopus laevis]|uniref:CDK5 regulatory subunit-associated protein 2 isoform X1 n=2 Tax=Xenopus laevis TaxID=8355 RepID=A0A1L8F6Z5_XENLA|nr:CDK5 regulatory subunit-associated protein 2 isoform X1 [Xenopus laevis]OCT67318.1 hypothetical protein XELAEV_18038610mg [Xenopus laevis]